MARNPRAVTLSHVKGVSGRQGAWFGLCPMSVLSHLPARCGLHPGVQEDRKRGQSHCAGGFLRGSSYAGPSSLHTAFLESKEGSMS